MASKPELEPCPFCGGEAVICGSEAIMCALSVNEDILGYQVCCTNKKCGVTTRMFPTPEGAAAAWNRREVAAKREAEGRREVMNIEELESVVDAMADEGGDQIDALYDTITLNKDTYNGFICRLREVVRLAKNEQEKSAPVGNAAAMRKALEKVYIIASTAKNDFDVFAGIERIWRISEWVLAAAPRNCDVGTEQEQGVRFNAFCKKDCDRCSACPKANKYGIETPCYLIWAQMPYQEGETDGSK